MKERIKKLCAVKGISLNQLETMCGLGKGYISKLGNTNPSTTKLKIIASNLGVTVDWLLGTSEFEYDYETQEFYYMNKISDESKQRLDFLTKMLVTKFGEKEILDLFDKMTYVDADYMKYMEQSINMLAEISVEV